MERPSGDFLPSQVPSHTSNPCSLFHNRRSFLTQSEPSQHHPRPSSELAPLNVGFCPEIKSTLQGRGKSETLPRHQRLSSCTAAAWLVKGLPPTPPLKEHTYFHGYGLLCCFSKAHS